MTAQGPANAFRPIRCWHERASRPSPQKDRMRRLNAIPVQCGAPMTRLLAVLIASSVCLGTEVSPGNMRANDKVTREAALPVGKWHVEFTNGVTEVCVIGRGGVAIVDEPQRRSRGRAASSGNAVVMTFNDDRVERWTQVGKRFVVEHWFPAAQFPAEGPVLGIAERTLRGRWSNHPTPAKDINPPAANPSVPTERN